MAFILRSAKFASAVIGVFGTRGLSIGRKKLFLNYPRVASISIFRRTVVTKALEENVEQHQSVAELEDLVYQLNRKMRSRDVSITEIEEVLNAIKRKNGITSAQLILLLKCCSQVTFMAKEEERIQMAENIWKSAKELGIKFDISHYNALLSAFVENNHKFDPEKFLDTLRGEKLEPNVITYQYILKSYCQEGNINGASKILLEMKELNYSLSERDFNSLIQGHCNIGEFDKCDQLLSIMESKEIIPGENSYITLVLGYAKHGKIEKMHELLEKLPEKKIFIGNPGLLEIIYTLAVNNHESEVEPIMKRLKEEPSNMYSSRVIQRLLHKKKDALAFKVFEHTTPKGLPEENALTFAKYILKHFVIYREPHEIMAACKFLEDKGCTEVAYSYALREVLKYKDEFTCLDFLNRAKKQGIEVRSHFYWPIIIKASKKGRRWMRFVLRKIPKFVFQNSFDTTHRVIFPNYNFENIQRRDLAFLVDFGVSWRLLNYCLFDKHLLNNNMKEAEFIISFNQITVNQWKHNINCLTSCLMENPKNYESFLNITYYYAHDYYYAAMNFDDGDVENEREIETEDSESESKHNFFDSVFNEVIKRLSDEQLIINLLEGMLSRKMGISPTTAGFIASLFKNEKITHLANELAKPEAQFSLDADVLRKRTWQIPRDALASVSDRTKNLIVKEKVTGLPLKKALGSDAPVVDCLFVALELVLRGKHSAVKILEELVERNADFTKEPPAAELLFKRIIFCLKSLSHKHVLEAIALGSKMGMSKENLNSVFRILLSRSNLDNGIDIFCQSLEQTGKASGVLTLLIKAAMAKKDEALDKIKNACSKIISPEVFANNLAIALATAGQINKARAALASANTTLNPKLLYTHCEFAYDKVNLEVFENYLKLVKPLSNFNRTPLYKLLIRKCADKNKIKKALELCTIIEEENVPDYTVLKEMQSFKAEPTLDNLKELSAALQRNVQISPGRQVKNLGFTGKIGNLELKQKENLIRNAVSKGNVDEVLEILEKSPNHFIKRAGVFFLNKGGIEEYFKIIEHYVNKGEFGKIALCFNTVKLQNFLQEEEHFQRYKSLAIRCLEEGFISSPLFSLFSNSVKLSSRLPEAEDILKQYSAHFRNIPFLELCEEAKLAGREISFYENFVCSEHLKNHFSDHLFMIYNRLIKFYYSDGKFMKALHYLEMAVSDGTEKYIDKNIIKSLEQKVKEAGRSFPYPELLSSTS